MKFKAIIEIEGETAEDLETTLEEISDRIYQMRNDIGLKLSKVRVTGEELEYKDVKII